MSAQEESDKQGFFMLILFFIALVLVLLALPIWPYSKTRGYRISVIFGIIAIVLLFFLLTSTSYVEYERDEEGTELKIERNY